MERIPPASDDPLHADDGEGSPGSESVPPSATNPVVPPAAEPVAPPAAAQLPTPPPVPPVPPVPPEPPSDHDLELRDRRRYVLGIALVILGVLLLAGQYVDIWRWAWPLVLVAAGLLLIFRDRRP